MKFRFRGIDETGSVVRGVLRAEGEEHARELLLGENVFEKGIEPAGEDEKVTWVPRMRILSRAEERPGMQPAGARDADAQPVRAVFQTRAVHGYEKPVAGKAGLTEDATFVFSPEGGGAERFVARPEELETVQLAGFPFVVLRLTMLSGRMYEFEAGFLVASGNPRAIRKELAGRLKSG